MHIRLRKYLRTALISLTLLPASCGSFYVSQRYDGRNDVDTACALECGEAVALQSYSDWLVELVFMIGAIALVFLWAWLVDRALKKVQ
jgi:hypothetical protein